MFDGMVGNNMVKDKLKAFILHFLISVALMFMATIVIFFVWYPSPYHHLFHVETIFFMMVAIDIILGPLLTLIVYKKGKKTLNADLTIIVMVQLLAFLWGFWQISTARPAWLVLYKDTIYAVSPSLINNQQQKQMSVFKQNWGKPKLVMVDNHQPMTEVIFSEQKYQPYTAEQAKQYLLPLSQVKDYQPKLYDQIRLTHPKAKAYFPIVTEASMDIPLLLMDSHAQPIATTLAKFDDAQTK